MIILTLIQGEIMFDLVVIIELFKSIPPKVRRILIALTLLGVGLGVKSCYETNKHDLEVIEATQTPIKKNIALLNEKYNNLSAYQQKYAKLLYYEKLKKNFDKEGIDFSQKLSMVSKNWVNKHLQTLHPDLTVIIPKETYESLAVDFVTQQSIPHPHPSIYVYAAYLAQQEKPLFEIKIDTKEPASINLYHVIAAQAKKDIHSKEDIDRAVYKLEHTMTYSPPPLSPEERKIMAARRARVNAAIKEYRQRQTQQSSQPPQHKTFTNQGQSR